MYVGLDPYMGLYHTERYGKPSLVLDLVEEFRVRIIDSTIFPLFLNKQMEKAEIFCQSSREFTGYRMTAREKS